MKLEGESPKSSHKVHKQFLGNGQNFKQKLPVYINEINLSNPILQEETPYVASPSIVKTIKFQTQKNKLKSQVSTTLQTSTKLFLFLTRTVMQGYSELIVYEYLKANGEHKSMQFNGIKGQIACLKAKFCTRRKQINCRKSQMMKNTKKSSAKISENQLQMVVFMGTSKGHLKVLRFNKKEHLEQPRLKIQSVKLDCSEIIDIGFLNADYFSGANLCLLLSLTNRVYLVNFDIMQSLTLFLPTILGCEVGLSLSVNNLRQYFIQSTEGGYIIYWDFSEHILSLIEKSTSQRDWPVQQTKQEGHCSTNTNFSPDDLFHCITPLTVFHTATISGLKHCQLYGNILLLITQTGILKLLSINKITNNHMNDNQYCSLLEYQIDDGGLVSDVRFYPQTMEIYLVKSLLYEKLMGRNQLEKYIPVKEIDPQKENNRKKKDITTYKPYKPKVLSDMKHNAMPDILSQAKTQQDYCCFQRITFNSQLELQRIDKIFPSHSIHNIESLQMTQNKDILVLRGRQFYLIGSTQIFNAQTNKNN